jgi:hypothetical protein
MNPIKDAPKAASVASAASVAAPPVMRPFPVKALPPALLDIVETVADSLQVPDVLTACCALAATSAAIGSGLRIHTHGDRTLRGNIYVVAAVPSGSGKTEAFNAVLEPVFERQRWLDDKAERRRGLAEVDRIILADQLKKMKAEVIGQYESGNDAPELRKKLAALLEQQNQNRTNSQRILCDDVTGAALEKLLSRNPMFSASDEAGTAILANLLGRFTKGSDEGIYVRAYSGGYHGGVDRIGRERVRLPDPCLTLLWLMQPAKLDTLFSQRHFREDGLLARVLACRIETRPRKVHSRRFAARYRDAVRQEWRELWLELHQTYHRITDKPHILLPTKEATAWILDYDDETVERRQQDLADMDSLAARWAEQAWRLAVVLHAARHGKEAHLEKVRADDTVRAAIEIADWFSEQQLALLAYSRAAAAETHERKVMDLLQSQLAKPEPRDWVTARDLVMSRVTATSLAAQQLLRKMAAEGKLICENCRSPHGGHTEKRYRGAR